MIANGYYRSPILSSQQINLIEDVCREADLLFSQNVWPEPVPCWISNVLRYTPIYLAEKQDRAIVIQRRSELEEKMRKHIEEKLNGLEEQARKLRDYPEKWESLWDINHSIEVWRRILDRLDQRTGGQGTALGWFNPNLGLTQGYVFICYEAIQEFCKASSLDLDSILVAVVIHELAYPNLNIILTF